jgi:hypothetical protein
MGWLSDAVSVAAPIAGGFIGNSLAPGVGGALGAQLGGLVGGALAGGQQVNQANQQLGQAAQMSQFRPVGVTTNFGTSKFGYDEQGRLNEAGYTLDPQLQGYQDQLAGMTGQGLTAGQGLMSLGQGYLGESPEAVRQRYMQQQNALLAPQNEQALAGIRNNLFQTGRGGLATGATEAGDMAATNPELAAYYNSLANQQRQIAAGAEQASQQQITFGQGLLTGAYDPFKAGLSTQQGVEGLGQGALDLGLRIGGQTTAGSTAAGNLLAQQQNPYTTAASSLLSNPQFASGIGKWFGGTGGGVFDAQPALAGATADQYWL